MDSALCDLFWAGEEIELAKADIDLSAMDDERRKSLRFGSAYLDAKAPKEFNRRLSQLLNFATTPFYRGRVEPNEGFLNWEPIDSALDWCEKMGIPAKGHPLFWMHRAGVPDWMHSLSFEDLKDVVYNQINQTVIRYKDRIKIWDVINEAHDPVEANVLDYTQEMRFELTALAAKAVKDADPKATRIVNVNRHFGYYRGEWETRYPLHPIEYLEELAKRNIDYEVLGIQMYHGGIGHWVRDMADQSAMMDRFSTFGKPIHITEVQSPSSMKPDLPGKRETFDPGQAGWWHKLWDPDTQADWVEQLYRIAISKSEIEAITWWSLSDRQTFWPSWGLLDTEDRPKPAYDRLLNLI